MIKMVEVYRDEWVERGVTFYCNGDAVSTVLTLLREKGYKVNRLDQRLVNGEVEFTVVGIKHTQVFMGQGPIMVKE